MSQSLTENLLLKAVTNHENKNFIVAEKLYKEVLDTAPQNINCINYLGTLYAQTNRKTDAKEQFLRAIKLDPNNPFVNNNLGNIFFENTQYKLAISYYEKAIASKPDFVDANYNLGIIYKNQAMYQLALDHLNKVIQLQPNNINSLALISVIYRELRNFKKAFQCYKKIFDIDKENYIATSGIIDLFNSVRLSNLSENNSKDLEEMFIFLYKKNTLNHNYLFNNAKNLIIFESSKKKVDILQNSEFSLIEDEYVKSVLNKEL